MNRLTLALILLAGLLLQGSGAEAKPMGVGQAVSMAGKCGSTPGKPSYSASDYAAATRAIRTELITNKSITPEREADLKAAEGKLQDCETQEMWKPRLARFRQDCKDKNLDQVWAEASRAHERGVISEATLLEIFTQIRNSLGKCWNDFTSQCQTLDGDVPNEVRRYLSAMNAADYNIAVLSGREPSFPRDSGEALQSQAYLDWYQARIDEVQLCTDSLYACLKLPKSNLRVCKFGSKVPDEIRRRIASNNKDAYYFGAAGGGQ